jgi:tRNA dimethylallyltransferase
MVWHGESRGVTGSMDKTAERIVRLASAGNPAQALLIAGPTAGGKSRLALAVAQALGGVVINADAMQVYRQLRVLSARPSAADEALAPHRLYGHVDGGSDYSVGVWLGEAERELALARAAAKPSIFVGGTGLYFAALAGGLSDLPKPDPAVREKWRAAAALSPRLLHDELARRDADAAARLHPGDTQRLVRALEVFDSTGRPIRELRESGRRPPPLAGTATLKVVLQPDRAVLHGRIAARLGDMVQAGALEEVDALLAAAIAPANPVMKAIGVREFSRHRRGGAPLAECLADAETATRQYAKRQITWFRRQFGPEWLRVD